MENGVLIYKLPKQLVDSAIKYLEETISIPLSSMKSKKMVNWGLELYFDRTSSFNKAILRGTIEIFTTVYHVYPLVTDLTVHKACEHVSEKCLKILMSTLGKVLFVYPERGPQNIGFTNNYRVTIHHPEIYEKIQSWPDSSAEVFGNDIKFPITFFCRLCRRNGHTRHQCPSRHQSKTCVQNTIKTEPDSTSEEDVKPMLYSQSSFEFQNSPKGVLEESFTQREETVCDIPLDLTLKTTKYRDKHCLDNNPVISKKNRNKEIKSSVKKRKSFSYKSLVPPSLRNTGESFTKFSLNLIRTPNPFEVAKQYPRGIEVLLEQLSSFVHFNLNLMETRKNCEKRFIIAIDSLIPKLKFQLQSERIAKTILKPEKCTEVLDFSSSSNAVVGSEEITHAIERTSIAQNHDAVINPEFDKISLCTEKDAKKGSTVVEKEQLQKPIVVIVDSKNHKVLDDLRRGRIPKEAMNKSVEKVREGNKLYTKEANKQSSRTKDLEGVEGKFKGVSFTEMMGSAWKKHDQTKLLTSPKRKVEKPVKKQKISKPDTHSKSSHNFNINKNVTKKCQSVKNFSDEVYNVACSSSNCSADKNSAKAESTTSLRRSYDSKIIDKAKTSKDSNNMFSYPDLSLKQKVLDKVVSAGRQIKMESNVEIHRGVNNLHTSSESTTTTVSEVTPKNEFQREKNGKTLVITVKQGLIEIPFSKGALTQTEMKAFLVHVKNKRNPYKIAERYSTDVGKIIQQLEQIVKKYYLSLNSRRLEDREIEWMVQLCKKLRRQETMLKHVESKRNETLKRNILAYLKSNFTKVPKKSEVPKKDFVEIR